MTLLIGSKVDTPHYSTPAIELKDVSVRYRLPQEHIPSLKEFAIRSLKKQIRYNEFWALHHINLEVQCGEVFGIIGPNGAGKSTLLKVISRVLHPATGRVRVRGRLAPLLELGAGFDYELTGRENIFLNSAILGFSRTSTQKRLSRIIEFAGLENFIDAPLRTYSSGMVARLGFSVATDMRPDILIVDEILSVGDAEFQTRSYERILGFRAEGTTILLVSHGLERVAEMCSEAIWLDHGEILAHESARTVVNRYLNKVRETEENRMVQQREKVVETRQSASPEASAESPRRWGTHAMDITQVKILNDQGAEQDVFRSNEPLVVQITYQSDHLIESPIFGIAIHRQDGLHISGPNSGFAGYDMGSLAGEGVVTFRIPALPLLDGLYHFSVAVVNHKDTEIFDYHDRLYPFRVSNEGSPFRERFGLITLNGEWRIKQKAPTDHGGEHWTGAQE